VPTDTKIAAADDEWVTIAQIAERLNMSHKGVRNKIAEGRLKAYELGPRTIRLRWSEVLAALEPYAAPGIEQPEWLQLAPAPSDGRPDRRRRSRR
jgi:excisionase family DNA binding protein